MKKNHLNNCNLFNIYKDIKNKFINKKDYYIPVQENIDLSVINNPRDKTQITWLGHNTFLIQVNKINIIVDPLFSKYLENVKRVNTSKNFPEKLPKIDYVIISHNHFDHLSFTSIKELKGQPKFIVPEGLKQLFIGNGYKDNCIKELSWFETTYLNKIKITFVPSKHISNRGFFNKYKSLWGGYIIEDIGSDNSIYFAGDSAYFNGFKTIGEKFKIKYALMPIDCYEPEWYKEEQENNVQNSVKAFKELKAEYFIPMHYGSYIMKNNMPKKSLEKLKEIWIKERLEKEKLIILKIDETLICK